MSFPPLDPATIGKAFKDGRAYMRPHRFTEHSPLASFTVADAIACMVAAAFIGFILGLGSI